ncbi:hypothetical protein CBOM_04568 [Ceraceosorus bombacis]|uniref:Uncharacterized protein n=1 Tax=Ceraceosorus bombacis TaxID=401625 RepID=A0A0P1BPZ9_9BASI|nr:hypothetical protein CBOM_04568 [Ceraceosorus bombacis]
MAVVKVRVVCLSAAVGISRRTTPRITSSFFVVVLGEAWLRKKPPFLLAAWTSIAMRPSPNHNTSLHQPSSSANLYTHDST